VDVEKASAAKIVDEMKKWKDDTDKKEEKESAKRRRIDFLGAHASLLEFSDDPAMSDGHHTGREAKLPSSVEAVTP
jgi:hypothetical protein